MANAPDRFALFILGPDEKRVEITEDTHIANAATVVLNKEDHTLGNMLRHAVLAVPGVLFSGYRVPHPLEPKTVLKIQTDGSLTPIQALKVGCEKVISQTGTIRSSFKSQCQQFQNENVSGGYMNSGAGMGMNAGGAGAAYGTAYGSSNVYDDMNQTGADGGAGGYVDI